MATRTPQFITYKQGERVKIALAAGETSAPEFCAPETVVVARPGSGGTMSVEATWSIPADVDAGTAKWFAWDAGAVSADTMGTLFKATAVRFTATTQPGTGEVAL